MGTEFDCLDQIPKIQNSPESKLSILSTYNNKLYMTFIVCSGKNHQFGTFILTHAVYTCSVLCNMSSCQSYLCGSTHRKSTESK